MPPQFTLGKNERLKSRKQIEQLFKSGKNFTVSPFKVFFLLSAAAEGPNLQFGVGAGTRHFKKAVDRNRIKRLTREAWRLQNTALKQKLSAAGERLDVFFIFTGRELPEFNIVKEKVAVALKKLAGIVNENTAADT